jgi:hypothetical protein
MFGILVSAGMRLLGGLLTSAIIKFVVFFALLFIVNEFFQLISSLIPQSGQVNLVLGGIPGSVWYFLDLFNFSAGLSAMFSAYTTRFLIRRLPVIG